jgi:putative ABC transport system ATP-binding protein
VGEPLIELKDVRKVYYKNNFEVPVLDGLTLSIPEGQFSALMGPSGSGKSTLLNLIGGLEQADGGEVYIDGQGLSKLSDYELSLFRRRKIGFIFQQLNLLPTMTAAENVALPKLIDGADLDAIRGDVDRCLGLVGMSARAGHRPDALSGGEQQRVAIARCLLMAPAVILADEPTGNLDTDNGRRVLEVLRNLTRGGPDGTGPRHTVVMVTHEARAAAYTDEIHFLRDGRVVGRERLDGAGEDGKRDAAFVADCYQRHEGAAGA